MVNVQSIKLYFNDFQNSSDYIDNEEQIIIVC